MITDPTARALLDAAKEHVLATARSHAYARQAFPTKEFDLNIEQTSWAVAEAIRAFDKLAAAKRELAQEGK